MRLRKLPRASLAIERLEDRSVPAALLTTPEFAAGQVLVTFADTNTADQLPRLAATPLAESVEPLGFGIYKVDLAPGASVDQAVGFYNALPGVLGAAPDAVIQVQATPNDPTYSQQYGLPRIAAPAAWDRATGTGQTVVAVIDTGVDYNHPDLAANIWTNTREVAGNGIDDDANGFADDTRGWDFANNDNAPLDDNRHGTHVAGIIGAVGNNAVGIAGVAWRTRIMPLKFLAGDGSGFTSNAVRSLDYAVRNGAKVVNASFGGGGADTALSTAIGRARDAGVVFVAAAGNAGTNNDTAAFFPANYIRTYDNVVTVAATDANDALASFSNRGAQTVTLAAPGVNIRSTLPNGGYGSLSGTSMATPFVAGAIALLWDANPTLTYRQVIDRLKATVDPVAGLAGQTQTGGRLNLNKLLAGVAVPPTSPPPAPGDTTGPRVTAAAFAGTAANQFTRARLTFSEPVNAASFTTADVVTLSGPTGAFTASGVTAVAGTNNTQFDVTFAARTAAGTYTLTVGPDITDAAGNRMDQNGNGVKGETPGDRFTVTGTIAAPATTTFTANGPIALGDNRTTNITFTIGQDVTPSDVNVRLNLRHTYTSDLVIRLTSPTGQTATLVNRRGGSGDNFTGTLFDDEAATSIVNGAAPFAGSFRPESVLSVFDGRNARGTWTLSVQDAAAQDVGTFDSISLVFTTGGTASVRMLGFEDAPPAVAGPTVGWFARDERPVGADRVAEVRQQLRAETRSLLGEPSQERAEPATEPAELTRPVPPRGLSGLIALGDGVAVG